MAVKADPAIAFFFLFSFFSKWELLLLFFSCLFVIPVSLIFFLLCFS